ncbi:MAG: FG-GAP-like repeat-containing protein [Verrucomicrobiota bacterium]|nr:FG-GAP-like repeat-containing protein [Verrucomicrobiota bacterium]
MKLKSLRSILLWVVILGEAAAVSAQNLPLRPLPLEPLEKYEDAPVYIYRLETSPPMVSQFGGFTSYQVNVDANGQNIVGDAANEPSICVDPTDHSRMAIGWRQFNSVNSNFRQAGNGFSINGGVSWTMNALLENNIFRSDPVLNADATGQFFYLSLLNSFFDDIWQSGDRGRSWARLASATGGDKQWFTIDNTNSSGHGFQYQLWSTAGDNYGKRQFSRSTDGGFTWLNPINIPNLPAWGTLDVDSNGTLFLAGVNFNTNQIWCERSTNVKDANATPSFDLSTPVNLGGTIASSAAINPVGLGGQIFVAVDRSGAATNNNVYLLAAVQPFGASTGTDVMFIRSSDGGQTFSAPRRINDDPVNQAKWHWLAALSVAPNGRLDSVWLDTRNAANNTDSQLFYSYSTDGGDTWSANVAVSAAFNPFLGYPQQNKIGDYLTIVSDNGGGRVAYTATFNGEEDVYYVRVAPPLAASAKAKPDFNGDGSADILWQNNATGQRTVWLMNRTAWSGLERALPTIPTSWQIAGTGDFNGDGKPDIVWQNSVTGQRTIWLMNGGAWTGVERALPTISIDWQIAGIGDFDGDGQNDLLWRNMSTGQCTIWLMSGATWTGVERALPTIPTSWQIAGVADFNGDGQPDIVWQNTITGGRTIWLMNGPTWSGLEQPLPTIPTSWQIAGIGDFDGDGQHDLLWQNTVTGQRTIWLMNASAWTGVERPLPTIPTAWEIRNR